PPSLEAGARRPFVGREAALATLREAWAHAVSGRPGLALVSGEAGIGKTRLAEAFAEEAHRDGALVLFGRCDEEPLGSYQPFVAALRERRAEERARRRGAGGRLPAVRGGAARARRGAPRARARARSAARAGAHRARAARAR